jgi:hypothetical protein
MGKKSYSRLLPNVDRSIVWYLCTNITKWKEWDFNFSHSELEGNVQMGTIFKVKHRIFPAVKGYISTCDFEREFILAIPLPLGHIYRRYIFEMSGKNLKLGITNSTAGLFSVIYIIAVRILNSYIEEDLDIIADECTRISTTQNPEY